MDDIKYSKDKFNFVYRVSAIIFNNDKSKVLLFYGNDSDFYMLPGGKVKEMETSINAIKREIEEELSYTNMNYKFVGISEEIINDKTENIHEITITYESIYNGEISKKPFKSKESEWINFKWVDIKDIKNYEIHPLRISEIILKKNNHLIEEINNSN